MNYYYTTQNIKDILSDNIVINVYSNQDIESKTSSEEPIATAVEHTNAHMNTETGFIQNNDDQKQKEEKQQFDLNESFKKQTVTVEKLDYLVSSFSIPSSLVIDVESTIRQFLNLDKKDKLVRVDV